MILLNRVKNENIVTQRDARMDLRMTICTFFVYFKSFLFFRTVSLSGIALHELPKFSSTIQMC